MGDRPIQRRDPAGADRDLLQSLEQLIQAKDDEGETATEMAVRLGKTVAWVRLRLHEAKSAGVLICGNARRMRIDGRPETRTVYRIDAKKVKASQKSK